MLLKVIISSLIVSIDVFWLVQKIRDRGFFAQATLKPKTANKAQKQQIKLLISTLINICKVS